MNIFLLSRLAGSVALPLPRTLAPGLGTLGDRELLALIARKVCNSGLPTLLTYDKSAPNSLLEEIGSVSKYGPREASKEIFHSNSSQWLERYIVIEAREFWREARGQNMNCKGRSFRDEDKALLVE